MPRLHLTLQILYMPNFLAKKKDPENDNANSDCIGRDILIIQLQQAATYY